MTATQKQQACLNAWKRGCNWIDPDTGTVYACPSTCREVLDAIRRCARIAAIVLGVVTSVDAQTIPRAALQYQRALIGNARFVWGLNAPIATISGQLEQESGWNPNARSKYANGLSQFTPETSRWLSELYPDELGDNAPFEPSWALRAVARYDKYLFDRVLNAVNECERMAMTLAGYNGGAGNVSKQRRAAAAAGANPNRWFGSVENFRIRATWAHTENRGYPRAIMLRRQQKYADALWGRAVDCKGVK